MHERRRSARIPVAIRTIAIPFTKPAEAMEALLILWIDPTRSQIIACIVLAALRIGAMTRYFFDVVGNSQSAYDFRGGLFSHLQAAYDWGQLLALDLEVGSGEEEPVGGRVGV